MSAATSRWKNCERLLAKTLEKYGIGAKRITRAGNYSESTWDVTVFGFPELKLDSKYSLQGFRTSRMLETVRRKYCPAKTDIPVLFCKGYKEISGKVTIDAEFFAILLSFWMGKDTKENLLAKFNKRRVPKLDQQTEDEDNG